MLRSLGRLWKQRTAARVGVAGVAARGVAGYLQDGFDDHLSGW